MTLPELFQQVYSILEKSRERSCYSIPTATVTCSTSYGYDASKDRDDEGVYKVREWAPVYSVVIGEYSHEPIKLSSPSPEHLVSKVQAHYDMLAAASRRGPLDK